MLLSANIQSRNPMKKVLGPVSLTLLCLGHIIGSGIFVLTGVAAHTLAGPAVVISYGIGAAVAGLSALAFAELGTQYPLAGASYNYVLGTFGEYPAWVTVTMMAADSILGGGAMARSWSSYLAVMCNKPSTYFQIPFHGFDLDFMAVAAVGVVTTVLVLGSKHTAMVNGVGKAVLFVLIALCLGFSYPHANRHNWDDFFPFGAQGVFAGASVIYFSYGGYNAASNFAEEAVDPARDLPIALFTSLGVSTVLYTLMACAITLMVPYQLINIQAPFSVAFHTAHEPWVAQLVSIGAVVAIGTVLLVSMAATTREFLIMARHNLIPGWLAVVHPKFGTPSRVIIAYGVVKSIMALLTDFKTLAMLTSVGTLFVTGMVSAALLFHRYHKQGNGSMRPALTRLLSVVASSFGFAIAFDQGLPYQANWPDVGFAVPLAPLLMSCSIFGDAFLLLSLGQKAILRFFIVLGIVLVLYVVYGVHGATRHDAQLADYIAASYFSYDSSLEWMKHSPLSDQGITGRPTIRLTKAQQLFLLVYILSRRLEP
ncbi:hypothetical protein WJX84_001578 [Apatococcus fuscideae]|uniref:Cationic amino acid transporter C-terminal domain-containing protein n=1 Tax=Apatococcus fuscideae TaxID=2026836 RepID=A0AAW1SLP2_9CHLO